MIHLFSGKDKFSMVLYALAIISAFGSTIFFGQGKSYGDVTVPVVVKEDDSHANPPPVMRQTHTSVAADEEYAVQAVLSPKRRAIIASGIDAKITGMDFENGDLFAEGDVLITYDCSLDQARLKEAQSRQRVTENQLDAYEKLKDLESVSEVEFLQAREANVQNIALVEQIQARLKSCKHIAPFDGRVTNKMASQYEYVQTGRVLMEIASSDPLRAEFLIPSHWLRWLNIGTPLRIYVGETGREYEAHIVAIHGEVDPVSQSIQVEAEVENYTEELLPGMSGRARFDKQTVDEGRKRGFLGLMLAPVQEEDHDSEID